jgi:hypothetical protein
MSRTKYYRFWKAPVRIWGMRAFFGSQGILFLYVFVITVWDAATKHAFTFYKLRPSGAPFSYTLNDSSEPHWLYWGFLVFYAGLCFLAGSFFSLVAYAATFRAVIPGYWKKKKNQQERT